MEGLVIMQAVKDIRQQFGEKLLNGEFVGNTIEIIGATFLADEIAIFGEVNHSWNKIELEWYQSISLNVNDINGDIPKIWKDVATPDGEILSNYGYMIWSEQNGYQYDNVLKKLKSDRNSRQGLMVYCRPSIHTEYNLGGKSDFICTIGNTFLIRNNKLVSHYVMRSQDSRFGYSGDRFWASEVQQRLAKDLDIEVGELIWTTSSQHIYSRHYFLVDHYNKTGEISITKQIYKEFYPNSIYI
jgi:thymidylate synthase